MDDADEYWFDEDAAQHVCRFFETQLRHVKGPWAGKLFELLPWERDLLRDLFGWKRRNGTRRYRRAYIEIPRKNGKSFLAAGIALYLTIAEGEAGGEIYSAAATRDQAALVYGMAADMLERNVPLMRHTKIRRSVKRILYPSNGSVYRAISSDAGAAHGFNASGIIFDEVHTQPDRELWDVLDTSTGARAQPLTIAITTAGYDRSSICWDLHCQAQDILDGNATDDAFYPLIFAADLDDDWTSPETWAKANPSIGHAVTEEYLREQCERAKRNPAFENTFRRLHLNQWTEQDVRIIQMAEWDSAAEAMDLDEMLAESSGEWFAAIDLSLRRDATSMVLTNVDEKHVMRSFPFFWIPEEPASDRAEQDQRILRNYAENGLVRMTPGQEIGSEDLLLEILDILSRAEVSYIGLDPWNARGILKGLAENGVPESNLQKMPQSFSTYNEPFKQVLSGMSDGTFRHNGDPVLRWMASNVVHRVDVNGNIRPDKCKSSDKIDGVCALLMSIALAIHYGGGASTYNGTDGGVILL